MISSLLFHHNKNLKQQTLGWTSVTALRPISVTAPCYSSVYLESKRVYFRVYLVYLFGVYFRVYLESKGKYILEARGHADPKDAKRKEALPAQL